MWPRQIIAQLKMTLLTYTHWLWCPCHMLHCWVMVVLLVCFVFSSAWISVVGSLMVLVLHDGLIHMFLSLVDWCSWYVYLAVRKYSSICAPSSSSLSSLHDLSVYLFLQFTHDGTTSNPKCLILVWCIVLIFWVIGRDDNSLRKCGAQLGMEWGTLGGQTPLAK